LSSLPARWCLVGPIVSKFARVAVWFCCNRPPQPKQGIETVAPSAECGDVEHPAHHCQMPIERGAFQLISRREKQRPRSQFLALRLSWEFMHEGAHLEPNREDQISSFQVATY